MRVEQDWFVRRDGSMVPVAYSSAPLETDEGRARGRRLPRHLRAPGVRGRARPRDRRAGARRGDRAPRARGSSSAAAEERRRIGRDLHDGAQQRLVQALMRIEEARRAAPSPALDAAAEETRRAVRDLRDLAAGIHPAVLTDHGLAAALEDLTADAALPVRARARGRPLRRRRRGRGLLPRRRGAGQRRQARAARTRRRSSCGATTARSSIAVSDDGRGGADPLRGSGLHGLADRVAALGGTLTRRQPRRRGDDAARVAPAMRP